MRGVDRIRHRPARARRRGSRARRLAAVARRWLVACRQVVSLRDMTLLALTLCAACAHYRPPPVAVSIAVPPQSRPVESLEGNVAFRPLTLRGPGAGHAVSETQNRFQPVGKLPPGCVFEPPVPVRERLTPPVYPPESLRNGRDAVTVAVIVYIDASGNVTSVQDAPAEYDAPIPDRARFVEATQRAVLGWRYEPAGVQCYQMLDTDRDGVPERHPVSWSLTKSWMAYEFTFEVKNGAGVVGSGP